MNKREGEQLIIMILIAMGSLKMVDDYVLMDSPEQEAIYDALKRCRQATRTKR